MKTVLYRDHRDGQPYRDLVAEHGSPLMILDAERLRQSYRDLVSALPGVRLYYAVKSFPEPAALAVLRDEGAGFDLASRGEVHLAASSGIEPRATIHTHPIKTDAEIRAALRYGCTTFVVDNGFEIQKFVRYRHRIGLLLRVSFRNPGARVDLSRKFGCDLDAVPELLAQAESLGLHVKGLSFHVGSQCSGPEAHVAAIEACASLIETLPTASPMSVLDIGGGFPVDYTAESSADDSGSGIDGFCAPIRAALARLDPSLEVIAEPGRCLSGPAAELVCTVVGRAERDARQWFYLDDGVYGAFSGQIFDGALYPLTFFAGPAVHAQATLAGPTCDSIDIVREAVAVPELGIGDIVVAGRIGAYTSASATQFNSLPRAKVVVIDTDPSEPAAKRAGGWNEHRGAYGAYGG